MRQGVGSKNFFDQFDGDRAASVEDEVRDGFEREFHVLVLLGDCTNVCSREGHAGNGFPSTKGHDCRGPRCLVGGHGWEGSCSTGGISNTPRTGAPWRT